MELINCHHDNLLDGNFGIKKTCGLLAWKYYWPTICHNVEVYVKGYDICLASKKFRHKRYGDCQSLLVPTHQWKDLLMDFVTGLSILIAWKGDSYNSILVIIDQLTKMVYYKMVMIIIDAPGLEKGIIYVIVSPRPLGLNSHWSRLFIYLKIPIIALQLSWH